MRARKLFSGIATATMAAALIIAPATAHANCGDDEQPACTGPVPSVDRVVAIMAELTDPNRPAASKTDVVTPGFAPEEAGTIDDHLNSLNARGYIPFNFVVTDIQPAPGNFAGATVVLQPRGPHSSTRPEPIVLVNQGGRWLATHDAATVFMDAEWSHCRARAVPFI